MPGKPVRPGRDDTTRYLCAAAHIDADFADAAIREFLVEPTRAVPPTPGVHAGAVLAEAVAARTRRKLRDAGLLTLIVAVLFAASWIFLIGWVIVGVLVALAVAYSTRLSGERVDPKRLLAALAAVVIGAAVAYALSQSSEPTGGAFDSGGFDSVEANGTGETVATVMSILVLALLLAVLLADEFVVWSHLNNRFRSGQVLAQPAARALTAQERPVFSFSAERFLVQLRRLLYGPKAELAPSSPVEASRGNGAERAPAPVVVARGYHMFVGSGWPHDPWSVAVPLRPRADDVEVTQLTTEVLYERITRDMNTMRTATNLSPGKRFADLKVSEQIVVAAEELIDHDDESARDFLANRNVAPYPMLRGHRVRELRDDPLEWARYYLCLQLETWDRDFVVSAYLHLAVNATTLYIEWTPCVLLPIKERYRKIDTLSDSPLPPIGRALLHLLTLPVTVLGRLGRLVSRIKPVPRKRGVVSPDMYGTRVSLRELAADNDMHNYFQLADRDRYLKMLESRLTLAIIDTMRDAGYSVATIEEQVATVANNNMYITNGSFTGNVVTGRGNTGGSVTTTGRSAAAKGTK